MSDTSQHPRIHDTAIVHPTARLETGVEVGPYARIEERVVVGEGTRIGQGAVIGRGTVLGRENRVHAYAVLGTEPQDVGYRGEETKLLVGNGNVFREFFTANRGTAKGEGITRIGSGGMFMTASHVAHDCQVGDRVILANGVLLGGHVQLGDGAVIGGQTGLHHFVRVGRLAFLGGGSGIARDAPPFLISDGQPSRVRGVNVVGLRRAGFDEATLLLLREAFREIWGDDSIPFSRALERVEKMRGSSPLIGELIDFLRDRTKSPKGRYLEIFRKDVAGTRRAPSGGLPTKAGAGERSARKSGGKA